MTHMALWRFALLTLWLISAVSVAAAPKNIMRKTIGSGRLVTTKVSQGAHFSNLNTLSSVVLSFPVVF